MKRTPILCGESNLPPPYYPCLGDSPSTRPILSFQGPSFISRRIEFLEIVLSGRLSFWPRHLWIYFVLSCPSCAILSLKFFRLWAPELFGGFLASMHKSFVGQAVSHLLTEHPFSVSEFPVRCQEYSCGCPH